MRVEPQLIADPSAVFTPADPKPQKRQRLIHALQTTVCPLVFSPRAVYDGNRLLYSSYNLENAAVSSSTLFSLMTTTMLTFE